jgi:hypothetical protein
MSYLTKQRLLQRLRFEAAGRKEIISRQRDKVRKALCDVIGRWRNLRFIVC